MTEYDTAAFVFLCIFVVPTLGFVFIRMMQHRERIEMIRRGMVPPGREQGWVMPPGASPAPAQWADRQRDPQSQLRKGIATTCIGVALLIGLAFIGYHRDGTFTLGPWLLAGLIPMFVGIAQVINAVLSGATIPTTTVRPTGMQGPPPSAPPPGGPYTYRPGATEELPRTKPPQNP